MKIKNITLIGRTFYPANNPRANRTTELAKELARIGHKVTVYAVLGDYDYTDFQIRYDVKVKNLGKMKFATLNSDGNELKKGYLERAFLKLIGRKFFEFPDIELAFKTFKVLKKTLTPIDLLITIAVPFPIHWGAAFAKHNVKYFPKTWVADCGDPYMGNKFKSRLFYFKYIEKWFCRKADYISIPIKEANLAYFKEFHTKIIVIPQGFNFDEVNINEKTPNNEKITFTYAGNFYQGIRDPRPFLDFLQSLNIDFLFIIYTKNKDLLKNYEKTLGDKLQIYSYIPRLQLIKKMSESDFLVNFENNTSVQSPSKLIDYALSERPILSINTSQLNENLILQFLNKNYTNKFIIEDINQYNIRNVASQFLKLE